MTTTTSANGFNCSSEVGKLFVERYCDALATNGMLISRKHISKCLSLINELPEHELADTLQEIGRYGSHHYWLMLGDLVARFVDQDHDGETQFNVPVTERTSTYENQRYGVVEAFFIAAKIVPAAMATSLPMLDDSRDSYRISNDIFDVLSSAFSTVCGVLGLYPKDQVAFVRGHVFFVMYSNGDMPFEDVELLIEHHDVAIQNVRSLFSNKRLDREQLIHIAATPSALRNGLL